MKFAADFRQIARNSLRGKWAIAVLVGLIAALLCGAELGGPELELELESNEFSAGLQIAGKTILSTKDLLGGTVFLNGGYLGMILVASLAAAVIWFVVGGAAQVGYARFNLELVDCRNPSYDPLFAYFRHWKTTTAARFLTALYTFLWSLLLVVPGVMAAYSYAMTPYIQAENPELPADRAITMSKQMMYGNRWRLFCLQFSFIGWSFLSTLTFGIGELWLRPYREAATAAFYREISGTWRAENEI